MFATLQTIARGVAAITAGVNLAVSKINAIQATETRIMAELDDLKASVVTLTTAVGDGLAEIKAQTDKIVALLGQPSISAADVEAAAVTINQQAKAIEDGVAAAKAAAGA